MGNGHGDKIQSAMDAIGRLGCRVADLERNYNSLDCERRRHVTQMDMQCDSIKDLERRFEHTREKVVHLRVGEAHCRTAINTQRTAHNSLCDVVSILANGSCSHGIFAVGAFADLIDKARLPESQEAHDAQNDSDTVSNSDSDNDTGISDSGVEQKLGELFYSLATGVFLAAEECDALCKGVVDVVRPIAIELEQMRDKWQAETLALRISQEKSDRERDELIRINNEFREKIVGLTHGKSHAEEDVEALKAERDALKAEKADALAVKRGDGQVWCRECGNTQRVNSGNALQTGWPKCCGYTMTIDAPHERGKEVQA